MSKRIILASTSPRRRELLAVFDFPFDVIGSDYDEEQLDCDSMAPQDAVMELALQKALTVAQKIDGDALVIGADTTVVLDGRYYQKPEDPADARRMLSELSGRTHQVYTGICVVPVTDGRIGVPETDYASTDVTFDKIPEDVIDAYVATGEPLDKAGAYGIQGKALAFIPGIKGDYFNVVGLCLEVIRKHLLPYFPDLPSTPPQPTFPAENYGDFSWGKNNSLGQLDTTATYVTPEQERNVAYHEAGHAFLAFVCQFAIRYVSILPGDRTTAILNPTIAQTEDERLRIVFVCWASYFSQALIGQQPNQGIEWVSYAASSLDRSLGLQIVHELAERVEDEKLRTQLVHRHYNAIGQLVQNFVTSALSPLIHLLATQLQAKKRLDGEQVATILSQAPKEILQLYRDHVNSLVSQIFAEIGKHKGSLL